ncbi:hypothetical protein Sjap_006717 [Stephania japonica]|uniref:F-box associated beta-propeller type 1 domain-containing protein n=1 Tax=Stephania japonica TaxID=461633 RepID=A0AAP0PLB4_9MAGN
MDYPMKSPHTYVRIEGSCNGLLMVVIYGGVGYPSEFPNFYIWNPCKKDDYISLPQPSCLSPDRYHWITQEAAGFCYDSILDDYKVIIIVSCMDISNYANVGIIYTTRTNTWRKLPPVPQDINICGSGYFTNGAVHWLARRKVDDGMRSRHVRGERDRILLTCFDIGSEEWREIPLGMDFEGDYEIAPQFSITSRGKLYMSYTYYHYGDNPMVVDFHTKVHELIDKDGQESCGACGTELWSLQSEDSFVRKVCFMVDNMVLVHADNYDDDYDVGEFTLHNFVEGKRLAKNAFVEVLTTQPFSNLNWLEAVRYCRSLVSPRQLVKFAS